MDRESSPRPATPKRPFAVHFGLKSKLVAVLLLAVPLAGVASYHKWRQAHKSYEQSLQSYNVGVIALEDVEQASEKLATIEGSRVWISNESAVRGHRTRMHEQCDIAIARLRLQLLSGDPAKYIANIEAIRKRADAFTLD